MEPERAETIKTALSIAGVTALVAYAALHAVESRIAIHLVMGMAGMIIVVTIGEAWRTWRGG